MKSIYPPPSWLIALLAVVHLCLSQGCRQDVAPKETELPAAEVAAVSQNVFKVGLPAPFSGSGAVYGNFMKQGAELAIEEINARGGVGGIRLQLVTEDGQGTPEATRAATQKLITQSKVDALFCAFNSDATLSMLPIVDQYRVPLVVGISAADPITEKGNPYVVRLAAPNRELARTMCDYLASDLGPKRVAIVFEKTNFGTGISAEIRELLQNSGISVVGYEGVKQHETEFMPLISKLRAAKPDVTFLIVLMDSAAAFLKQARGAAFSSRWANVMSLSNPKFLDDMQDLADGFIGITPFVDTTSRPAAVAFVEAFRRKYDAQTVTHYSAMSYETVYVVADALSRGGKEPDRFLEALRATSLDGISGHIAFDSKGQAHIGTIIFTWKGGKRTVVREYRPARTSVKGKTT